MREIKFRAWDKELKIMVYSDEQTGFIEYDANPLRVINIILNEDDYGLEFMQYTGLKDKNDKEIFEGDIVKVNCPYSFKLEVGTICYNDGCFDIIGNTGGRDYLKCHTANHAVKVIGNIYENPELLEEQNENL